MSNRHAAIDLPDPDDDDLLYRRLQPGDIRDGEVRSEAAPLSQWKQGLSCDWSVLACPEDTVNGKFPSYVLIITVRECRRLGIDVRYDPIDDPSDPNYNLAHCVLRFPPDAKSKVQKRRLRDDLLASEATTWQLIDPPWYRRLWYRLRTWTRGRRMAKDKSHP